jgi:hypothetical protein
MRFLESEVSLKIASSRHSFIARGHTPGKMLAVGFTDSTGKSTIGVPHRQMQFDRFSGHLRQISATQPGFADCYNPQGQITGAHKDEQDWRSFDPSTGTPEAACS